MVCGLFLLASTWLGGCAKPDSDTRTVCEWVLMEERVGTDVTPLMDEWYERILAAADTTLAPDVNLALMRLALEHAVGQCDSARGIVQDMQRTCRSPVVLDVLSGVDGSLAAMGGTYETCLNLILECRGEPDRFRARESQFMAAYTGLGEARTRLEQAESSGREKMMAAARRLLTPLRAAQPN